MNKGKVTFKSGVDDEAVVFVDGQRAGLLTWHTGADAGWYYQQDVGESTFIADLEASATRVRRAVRMLLGGAR